MIVNSIGECFNEYDKYEYYWIRITIDGTITYKSSTGKASIDKSYMLPYKFIKSSMPFVGRTAISKTPAGALALVEEALIFLKIK